MIEEHVICDTISTNEELEQILAIQQENHPSQLSEDKLKNSGFVTLLHTLDLLQEMNQIAPHIIAKVNDEVVGYALSMDPQLKNKIPILYPMFKMMDKVHYRNKKLTDWSYYVMGQICVKDGFKRKGIFSKMYHKHKEVFQDKYDLCITEVATRNIPSIKAHEKVGFKTVYEYQDTTDKWNIIAWDWSQ